MGVAAASPTPELQRQVMRLQMLTIVWMTVEAFVALAAAWKAQSPALLGFGGDSAVELLSAIVVLWRFRSKPNSAGTEKLAARVAGGLLFVLATLVIGSAGLSLLGYREPRRTLVGTVVLVVAGFGMPWLASMQGWNASSCTRHSTPTTMAINRLNYWSFPWVNSAETAIK